MIAMTRDGVRGKAVDRGGGFQNGIETGIESGCIEKAGNSLIETDLRFDKEEVVSESVRKKKSERGTDFERFRKGNCDESRIERNRK